MAILSVNRFVLSIRKDFFFSIQILFINLTDYFDTINHEILSTKL